MGLYDIFLEKRQKLSTENQPFNVFTTGNELSMVVFIVSGGVRHSCAGFRLPT